MVLFTLLEIGAQGSIFVLKQTYYLGRYLVFGRQKTKEEILEEKLEKQMEEEKKLLHEMRELIDKTKSENLRRKSI
jgi:hypothetical protein